MMTEENNQKIATAVELREKLQGAEVWAHVGLYSIKQEAVAVRVKYRDAQRRLTALKMLRRHMDHYADFSEANKKWILEQIMEQFKVI